MWYCKGNKTSEGEGQSLGLDLHCRAALSLKAHALSPAFPRAASGEGVLARSHLGEACI